MKIIRHTARDMRQALRAVREQLGEDAVILSSRRTSEGVEVTAAVDFDAATLEAGGFANAPTCAPATGAGQPAPAAVHSAGARTPSAPVAPLQSPEPTPLFSESDSALAQDTEWISPAARAAVAAPEAISQRGDPASPSADLVEQARASSLASLGAHEEVPGFPGLDPSSTDRPPQPAARLEPAAASPSADALGNELKTLRRMLETQLAHLAWNDLTRRAPIRTEILRELTEIGITQDLAEHLVRQLPEDTDLTFGRRFTIAGLSQYLRVTGDRWLDEGGRVAFAGATGVGKTTTLAKVAVRWVLRNGPRELALVAADPVRIGAQDQLQSLGQLLGVPVYTPDRFESLPTLVAGLTERLVLIDTPGSSARDASLGSRLAVLASSASQLETTLVLCASTQAGALEEAVKRFAPANPSCCILTKLDEATSLGGVLSILIRARLPVSYLSEGQRVPEDLRPARALELVSAAVRLAKASGAAADEDLLRRRFGKTAHGIP